MSNPLAGVLQKDVSQKDVSQEDVAQKSTGTSQREASLLRRMWRVASLPSVFFNALAEHDTMRLAPAFATLSSAWVAASLWVSVTLVLATGSAFAPVVTFVSGAALCVLLFWWGLGGLSLQRPGNLDTRSWEVAGWSWAPLLFTSLSLLPVTVIIELSLLPDIVLTALVLPLGLLWALGWHLQVLREGVAPFVEGRATRVVVIYAALLFVVPLAIMGFIVVAFSSI